MPRTYGLDDKGMPTSPDLKPAPEGESTPTPWLVDGRLVYALQDCAPHRGWPTKENRFSAGVQGKAPEAELEANAAFIVRAVNGHAALVARVAELEAERDAAKTESFKRGEYIFKLRADRDMSARAHSNVREDLNATLGALKVANAERDTLRTHNAALVEALKTILRTERLTIRGARNIAREALEADAALALAGKGR